MDVHLKLGKLVNLTFDTIQNIEYFDTPYTQFTTQ